MFGKRPRTDNDWTKDIPDYLNDLNAMHEAEKALVEHPGLYWFALAKVVGGSLKDVACATASQRAEAFLRTLNLWNPTPCAT